MAEPILVITNVIRGGGFGRGAWIARILGPDPKFGLKREFLKSNSNLSGSGKSGTIDFPIYEPGFYEVRGVQRPKGEASIGDLWNAFIEVDKSGKFREVTKETVVKSFK